MHCSQWHCELRSSRIRGVPLFRVEIEWSRAYNSLIHAGCHTKRFLLNISHALGSRDVSGQCSSCAKTLEDDEL